MNERFTVEELALAKTADLCDVASALGYTVKRIGNYFTLKEMDSIRIYNRSHWYRWSREYDKGNNGGSQIDFLRVFAGMSVKEAVFWLLDFVGYKKGMEVIIPPPKPVQEKERKPFILPEPASDNQRIIEYLVHQRGLDEAVVLSFIEKGILYEVKAYHNVVFVGTDVNGVARFASLRGIYDKNGKGFRCDVAGNDKRYGFNVAVDSEVITVFEAAIDLMSYVDLFRVKNENLLALGMLSDAPLEMFLSEHGGIKKIRFCLDNDEPGREASRKLSDKYLAKGYEVQIICPPEQCKDMNEWLAFEKYRLKEEQGIVR